MATLVHDDVLDDAPLRRGQPDGRRHLGPRSRHRDRRPALLACLRAARDGGGPALDRAALVGLGRARPRRARPASRRLRHLDRREPLPGALPAEDRDPVRMRLPARPRRGRRLGRFGAAIGLAFQLLDDVLDVSGPPERTGKARGTDLLDGTVTLPLILAAERDPTLAAVDLRSLDAAAAERLCDRIEATGALRAGSLAGAGDGRGRQAPARRRAASTPNGGSCSTWSPTASSSVTAERSDGEAEVVGRDQVRARARWRRSRRSPACSPVRARAARSASSSAPSSSGLVEGVDLALAVDAVAAPLALGAAPPEAPVPALRRLLPAGRLHQLRVALGADVQPGVGLRA